MPPPTTITSGRAVIAGRTSDLRVEGSRTQSHVCACEHSRMQVLVKPFLRPTRMKSRPEQETDQCFVQFS